MAKGKSVLTTGDVAKICNVAPRTVSKWFDNGRLKGYRIPGSKDRRIPLNELVRFMKTHNMPLSQLPIAKIRVLIADSNTETASILADNLKAKTDYEVQTVHGNFETGLVAQKFTPHVLIVNLFDKSIDAADICRNIHSTNDLEAIKVIAIANISNELEANALFEKGFDNWITNPSDITDVIKKIEEATTIIY